MKTVLTIIGSDQYRRTARPQGTVADLGHFQDGGDGLGEAPQFTTAFQVSDKGAQIDVAHARIVANRA